MSFSSLPTTETMELSGIEPTNFRQLVRGVTSELERSIKLINFFREKQTLRRSQRLIDRHSRLYDQSPRTLLNLQELQGSSRVRSSNKNTIPTTVSSQAISMEKTVSKKVSMVKKRESNSIDVNQTDCKKRRKCNKRVQTDNTGLRVSNTLKLGCPICFEEVDMSSRYTLESYFIKLKCHHTLCSNCYPKLKFCPWCKVPSSSDGMVLM